MPSLKLVSIDKSIPKTVFAVATVGCGVMNSSSQRNIQLTRDTSATDVSEESKAA